MENLDEEQLNRKLDELIIFLALESKDESINDSVLSKKSYLEKKDLFSNLLLSRKIAPLSSQFLKMQNEYLAAESKNKLIVEAQKLTYIKNMSIICCDIVRLKIDAIVCSCRENLVGNFDINPNAVSSDVFLAGGLQVKQEMSYIISKQNHNEPCGSAKIVKGHNLPSDYVICTVGPKVVNGRVGYKEKEDLIKCYNSCLDLAQSKGLGSIAFCSISTGSNKFPRQLASEIAVSTVYKWLTKNNFPLKVVFCIVSKEDEKCYETSFKEYVIM